MGNICSGKDSEKQTNILFQTPTRIGDDKKSETQDVKNLVPENSFKLYEQSNTTKSILSNK